MVSFKERLKKSTDKYDMYAYYKSIGCSDEIALFLSFYTYSSDSQVYLNKYIDIVKKEVGIKDVYTYLGGQIKYVLSHVLDEKSIKFSDILSYHPKYSDLNITPNKEELELSAQRGIFGKNNMLMNCNIQSNSCIIGQNVCNLDSSFELDEDCAFDSSYDYLEENILAKYSVFPKFYRTDSYSSIVEKGFKRVIESPFSSFKMTTNNASMGVLLNNLMYNSKIEKSMIRIEEIMNSVDLGLKKPKSRKFNYITRLCDKPNSKNKLFFVGVQSKDIDVNTIHQNITILLDISGSMYSNTLQTQASLISLFMHLKTDDVLSLVTYSTNDAILFENRVVGKDIDITDFISYLFGIKINGCTYGSKGIETAYRLTQKTYREYSSNRVVLITDGDLNFGINSNDGLQNLIEEKRKTGIFLTVIGTGLYNYKDDKLEILSKYGNGNYCVINNIFDAFYNLSTRYNSMMFTIAKDVKAEVEFNPYFVKSYRLLGYENREISHSEFKDDSVVSDPFGSGSWGIALYELELNDENGKVESELKYTKMSVNDIEHLCTIRVRYKEIDSDVSKEQSLEINFNIKEIDTIVNYIYSIFVLCEKYRGSKYIIDSDLDIVKSIMQKDDIVLLDNKNYGLISLLCKNN